MLDLQVLGITCLLHSDRHVGCIMIRLPRYDGLRAGLRRVFDTKRKTANANDCAG